MTFKDEFLHSLDYLQSKSSTKGAQSSIYCSIKIKPSKAHLLKSATKKQVIMFLQGSVRIHVSVCEKILS